MLQASDNVVQETFQESR